MVRANAAALLTDTFPLQNPDAGNEEIDALLQTQFDILKVIIQEKMIFYYSDSLFYFVANCYFIFCLFLFWLFTYLFIHSLNFFSHFPTINFKGVFTRENLKISAFSPKKSHF